MYLDFVKTLFFLMQDHNLGYIYKGIFTPEVTDTVLFLTENKLEKQEESSKLKKRVYHILVEALQNVVRHQAKDEKRNPFHDSLFLIQKIENRYVITTGNIVKTENIPFLQAFIDKINTLSKEELKEYYMKILEEGTFSEKGGAGLGLLDIARKSGNKLLYKFVPFSKDHSYFYLCVIPTLEDQQTERSYENDFRFVELIHSILNKEDISIINNGPFNQENLITFLNSLEGQMLGNVGYKKKVFYIVIEMIQNIIKHGYIPDNYDKTSVPGIFLLGQIDDKYRILTGNFIENNDLVALKQKIDRVNNMSSKELEDYYNDFLFNFGIDDSKKSGLGMIDIRIKSKHPIYYDILPINNQYSFLSLQSLIYIE
ncbi:MAG: SiaB family protein kinase [Bacteroidales bacterium]|nr:SiaB family protein kinase [Bacteroidales bacterium]